MIAKIPIKVTASRCAIGYTTGSLDWVGMAQPDTPRRSTH
jgi:hypothetical protein